MKLKRIATTTLILCIIAYYIWLISVGLWTTWPPTTNYYDQLASAFARGQLHLQRQPDPRLLQLENPYNPAARSGIPTPLDISLYNGKFYLYWGPIPGLLLAPFKLFLTTEIGDQYLVFIILTGILLLETLILFKIKNIFFPDLPHWIILLSIAVTGLITPSAWMYNNPRVYDVAIGSGQFFFLAGLYMVLDIIARRAFSSTKQSPSIPISTAETIKLILAGIFWFFVIGSRLTQVILIAFIALMVLIWLFKQSGHSIKSTFPYALAIGMPIAIGFILLGWYNYARFGSVFETGFNYAMAGPYLQKYKSELFLPVYIPQNLYNYLLQPIGIRETYPFLKSTLGRTAPILSFYALPKVYTSDEITGLIYAAPFLFFSAIALLGLRKNAKTDDDQNPKALFNWIVISLFGSFIFAFAPLLMFFWLSTRYMMDFMPQITLLSVVGFWQGYDYLKRNTIPKILYAALGIALALSTIIVSNALGLSSHTARIKAYNPELWHFLIDFFAQ